MNADDSTIATESISRRRFLIAGGSAGGAAVGGCAAITDEGSEANDGSSPSSTSARRYDARFRAVNPFFVIDEFDWNPFTADSPDDRHGMFAQWTQYLVGEDQFHPHLIEEWKRGDSEFELTLSDGFSWAGSGDPVTAADLAFQLDVYQAADHLATRFVDSAEVTTDDQLTISFPTGTNAELVEYTVLPLLADIPPANWQNEDWEVDPTAVSIQEPDAAGPIVHTDRTNIATETAVRHDLEGFADHPLAAHYNWRGYEVVSSGSEGHPMQNAETDGVYRDQVSGPQREDFPESVRTFEIPIGHGLGLWFDHSSEPWSHREVRQALLHVIDRDEIQSELLGYPKEFPGVQTGLTAPSVERWLGSSEPDGFSQYDGGTDRANELLADVGYEPGDIEATILTDTRATWSTARTTIVDQLQAAGWNVSGDWTSDSPEEIVAADDFDIVAYSHKPPIPVPTNWAYPHHPYFALEYLFRGHYDEEGHFAHYDPGTISVDGEPVDVEDDLEQVAHTSSRMEQRPIVERLARVVNHDVPCAIVMESVAQSFIDTDSFSVPASSKHLETYWPQWWLPKVDESLHGYQEPGLLKYDPA